MLSLRLFRMTLNTRWVSCTPHMVQSFSNPPTQLTNIILRCWSINRSPFCHIHRSNRALVVSLSYFAFPGYFEYGHSCRSFQIPTAGWYVFVFPTPPKNMILMLIVTECLRQAGEIISNKLATEEIHDGKLSQLMKNKTVHLLSLFLMLYIGVEVTIGGMVLLPTLLLNESLILVKSGWIVTFLMIVRGGGPSSGFVSTGFFGGMFLVNCLALLCEISN